MQEHMEKQHPEKVATPGPMSKCVDRAWTDADQTRSEKLLVLFQVFFLPVQKSICFSFSHR